MVHPNPELSQVQKEFEREINNLRKRIRDLERAKDTGSQVLALIRLLIELKVSGIPDTRIATLEPKVASIIRQLRRRIPGPLFQQIEEALEWDLIARFFPRGDPYIPKRIKDKGLEEEKKRERKKKEKKVKAPDKEIVKALEEELKRLIKELPGDLRSISRVLEEESEKVRRTLKRIERARRIVTMVPELIKLFHAVSEAEARGEIPTKEAERFRKLLESYIRGLILLLDVNIRASLYNGLKKELLTKWI